MPKGCGEARAVATQVVSEPEAVSLLPKGEGISAAPPLLGTRSATSARLAERINEARVTNEIKRIVGSANVTRFVDSEIASNLQLAPNNRAVVVAPATTTETSEVIKLAAREKLSVVPAGRSSWLDAGNLLLDADLIVTTRRMSSFVDRARRRSRASAESPSTATSCS